MKTKALILPNVSKGILMAGITVAAFASYTMFAQADTAPTIATLTYNSSNVQASTANIGTNVYATAGIGSSSTTTLPTGTVTFNRYSGIACTGVAATQVVALTNGSATSSQTAMTSGGISYIVRYNGDAFNAASDGACKPIAATAAAVTLTGTLSTTTAVLAGTSVSETSTLANATAGAGGSVAYNVYSNNSCTALWQSAGSKAVVNAVVPNSDAVAFNFAGTYYWQGVYSGDSNNTAATTSCAALTVIATSTPPVIVVGSSTISGTVFNDANKNDKLDAGEVGIAGFTIKLYKGAGWWGPKGNNNPIATVVSDTNGNYSFANLANGIYSVEEIKKAGWKQTSSDFKKLEIKNGVGLSGNNFANVTQASTTANGGHGRDDNDDNDDNHGNKGGKKSEYKKWLKAHSWQWWKSTNQQD